MDEKRKINKADAIKKCAELLFSGQISKDIVKFFTEKYGVSTSAVQKWMKAARPIVQEHQQQAKGEAKGKDGRPALFDTPEQMELKLDEYREWVKGERRAEVDKDGLLDEWIRPPEPVTITGLCIFMGFESRQSFYDYQKRKEFSYIIKKARLFVENSYERRLHGQHVSGPIFALKNMGWADKVEQEMYGKGGGPIESKHVVEFYDFSDDNQAEDKPAI